MLGLLSVAPILLAGCAVGAIHSPTGDDALRTALSFPWQDSLLLLLANSPLDCVPEESDDPNQLTLDLLAREAALTREGARIVFAQLWRYQQDDWTGFFPVHADASVSPDAYLDGTHRGVATALYYGVEEAVLGSLDGLERTYDPVVAVQVEEDAPSYFRVFHDGERLWGTFQLAGADVGGWFRAAPCEEVDLLYWMDLLDATPHDARSEAP